MIVGVPLEMEPGERRVALTPANVAVLTSRGLLVLVEVGAGVSAGYLDSEYLAKGARLVEARADLFNQANVVVQVRAAGASPRSLPGDKQLYRPGQLVVAMLDPLSAPGAVLALAETGATAYALELVPRITRAQSMDVLSSMATVAGYRAVLLAATALPRLFPMLMTAAGTLSPARTFVVGAGVAGLQAIATARRLGSVVQAYDVRPAVKEQVESLGGSFLEILPAEAAEGEGGYAREMDAAFYQRQQAAMAAAVAESNVVITTAAVPGRKAPVLVSAEMIAGMKPGSVVVDLAAERGGNCELTVPGETVEKCGVSILGPLNLPAEVPFHSSQMFGKNVTEFLLNMLDDEGNLAPEKDDEIVKETAVCRSGVVTHPRVAALLESKSSATGS